MFVPDKYLVVSASKTEPTLRVEHIKRHYTIIRLCQKVFRDKHSSLFFKSISDEKEKFYYIVTGKYNSQKD